MSEFCQGTTTTMDCLRLVVGTYYHLADDVEK